MLLWALVGYAVWQLLPGAVNLWTLATAAPGQIAATERSLYFPNCDAARAAGVAPIDRGRPGYREALDGDSDGVACEPWR